MNRIKAFTSLALMLLLNFQTIAFAFYEEPVSNNLSLESNLLLTKLRTLVAQAGEDELNSKLNTEGTRTLIDVLGKDNEYTTLPDEINKTTSYENYNNEEDLNDSRPEIKYSVKDLGNSYSELNLLAKELIIQTNENIELVNASIIKRENDKNETLLFLNLYNNATDKSFAKVLSIKDSNESGEISSIDLECGKVDSVEKYKNPDGSSNILVKSNNKLIELPANNIHGKSKLIIGEELKDYSLYKVYKDEANTDLFFKDNSSNLVLAGFDKDKNNLSVTGYINVGDVNKLSLFKSPNNEYSLVNWKEGNKVEITSIKDKKIVSKSEINLNLDKKSIIQQVNINKKDKNSLELNVISKKENGSSTIAKLKGEKENFEPVSSFDYSTNIDKLDLVKLGGKPFYTAYKNGEHNFSFIDPSGSNEKQFKTQGAISYFKIDSDGIVAISKKNNYQPQSNLKQRIQNGELVDVIEHSSFEQDQNFNSNDGNENVINPICGNGVVESGEHCDDGNSDCNDGCCNCEPGSGVDTSNSPHVCNEYSLGKSYCTNENELLVCADLTGDYGFDSVVCENGCIGDFPSARCQETIVEDDKEIYITLLAPLDGSSIEYDSYVDGNEDNVDEGNSDDDIDNTDENPSCNGTNKKIDFDFSSVAYTYCPSEASGGATLPCYRLTNLVDSENPGILKGELNNGSLPGIVSQTGSVPLGINGYIETPRLVDLSGNQLAIETIIRVSQFQNESPYISTIAGIEADGEGAEGVALLRLGDATLPKDKVQFVLRINNVDVRLNSNSNLLPGKWYEITAAYDGHQMRIYINGVLDSSNNIEGNITAKGKFRAGKSFGGRYFNGRMRKLNVYNCLGSEFITGSECADLDESLVLYFDANNIDGNGRKSAMGLLPRTWTDLSGKNNHGTLSENSSYQWSHLFKWSNYPEGLNFNNLNHLYPFKDQVEVYSSNSLKPTKAVTVCAKLKALNSDDQPQGAFATILAKEYSLPRTSPYVSYKLSGNNEGNSYGFEVATNYFLNVVSSGVKPLKDVVNYVCGVYDGTAAKIYVDGELKGSKPASGDIKYATSNEGKFYLGANGERGEGWVGNISEARVYNCPLNTSQIRLLTHNALTGPFEGLLECNGVTVSGNCCKSSDCKDVMPDKDPKDLICCDHTCRSRTIPFKVCGIEGSIYPNAKLKQNTNNEIIYSSNDPPEYCHEIVEQGWYFSDGDGSFESVDFNPATYTGITLYPNSEKHIQFSTNYKHSSDLKIGTEIKWNGITKVIPQSLTSGDEPQAVTTTFTKPKSCITGCDSPKSLREILIEWGVGEDYVDPMLEAAIAKYETLENAAQIAGKVYARFILLKELPESLFQDGRLSNELYQIKISSTEDLADKFVGGLAGTKYSILLNDFSFLITIQKSIAIVKLKNLEEDLANNYARINANLSGLLNNVKTGSENWLAVTLTDPELWNNPTKLFDLIGKHSTCHNSFTDSYLNRLQQAETELTQLSGKVKELSEEIIRIDLALAAYKVMLLENSGCPDKADDELYSIWKKYWSENINKYSSFLKNKLGKPGAGGFGALKRLEEKGKIPKYDLDLLITGNPSLALQNSGIPKEDLIRIINHVESLKYLEGKMLDISRALNKMSILLVGASKGEINQTYVNYAKQGAQELIQLLQSVDQNKIDQFNGFLEVLNQSALYSVPELNDHVLSIKTFANKYLKYGQPGYSSAIAKANYIIQHASENTSWSSWAKEELAPVLVGMLVAVTATVITAASMGTATPFVALLLMSASGSLGFIVGQQLTLEFEYQVLGIGDGSLLGQVGRGGEIVDESGEVIPLTFSDAIETHVKDFAQNFVISFITLGLGKLAGKAINKIIARHGEFLNTNVGTLTRVSERFLRLLGNSADDSHSSFLNKIWGEFLQEMSEEFALERLGEEYFKLMEIKLWGLEKLLPSILLCTAQSIDLTFVGGKFKYNPSQIDNLKTNIQTVISQDPEVESVTITDAEGGFTVKIIKKGTSEEITFNFSANNNLGGISSLADLPQYQDAKNVTGGNVTISQSQGLNVNALTTVTQDPSGKSISVQVHPTIYEWLLLENNEENAPLINIAKQILAEEFFHVRQPIVNPKDMSEAKYKLLRYLLEFQAEARASDDTETFNAIISDLIEVYSNCDVTEELVQNYLDGYASIGYKITQTDKDLIAGDYIENTKPENVEAEKLVQRSASSGVKDIFAGSINQTETLEIILGDQLKAYIIKTEEGNYKLIINGKEKILQSGISHLTLGRDSENDIDIDDSYDKVSRKHLLIIFKNYNNSIKVIDLGSSNGTKVNVIGNSQASVEDEFDAILKDAEKIRVKSIEYSSGEFEELNLPKPKYKIVSNGTKYFLSEPFFDTVFKRPSFILYIVITLEDGTQQVFVRGLYKSNSQVIWRVASHMAIENTKWLGKGIGERTTNLPIEIQSKIAKIEEDNNWNFTPDSNLVDVLRQIEEIDENGELNSPPPETFIVQGGELLGKFTSTEPSSFVFTDNANKPNFNNVIKTYKTMSSVYGEVTSYIFESENNQLVYLFNVDSEGRAWIGDIQYKDSLLNDYGVNLNALIVSIRFVLPGYEYEKQIPPGYKGNQHPTKKSYFDASSFTNNITLIKEFLNKIK